MEDEFAILRDEMVAHNREMELKMSNRQLPAIFLSMAVPEILQRQSLGKAVIKEEQESRREIQIWMRTWIRDFRITSADWIHSTHELLKHIDRSIRTQRKSLKRAGKPVPTSIPCDEPPPYSYMPAALYTELPPYENLERTSLVWARVQKLRHRDLLRMGYGEQMKK